MSPYVGELLGTMILVILGDGVVANVSLKRSKAEGADWIVTGLAWGLAVTMAVYAVGSISGGHVNPAVTIGMALNGSLPWAQVPGYIISQIIGGVLGGIIVYFHFLPHWKETTDPAAKLGVFATGPAIRNYFSNFVSEVIGTAILLLGLLTIGANEFTEGLNPIAVGFLIVAIGLSLGGTTGYAINPARDLGPRIAHALLPIPGKGGSDWKYAWIPVLGPIVGGGYGSLLYSAFFLQKHWTWFIAGTIALALILTVVYVVNEKRAKLTQMQEAS